MKISAAILIILAAMPMAFGIGALGAFLPDPGYDGRLLLALGAAAVLDAMVCFWLIGKGHGMSLLSSLSIFRGVPEESARLDARVAPKSLV